MTAFSSKNMFWLFTSLIVLPVVFAGQGRADGQHVSLPDPASDEALTNKTGQRTAVFAGGCFWGIEAVFRHVTGVVSATSGYAGGSAQTADYEQVSTGKTGHAESVQVVYDPQKISYGQLLKIFFAVGHNPTELNRQGPDHGTQYRSAIFTTSDSQYRVALSYINQLQALRTYGDPVVTQVQPLAAFYPAEDHHQNYLAQHPRQPYIVINDLPKIQHLREQFPGLYR